MLRLLKPCLVTLWALNPVNIASRPVDMDLLFPLTIIFN